MSKAGSWEGDNSFAGGERSDLPAHLIPQNALLQADNVVLTKLGRLSKRGPVQPYLLNTSNDTLHQLAQYKLTEYNPSFRGFALGETSAGAQRWFTFGLPQPPGQTRAGYLSDPVDWDGPTASQNNALNFVNPVGPTAPSFNYLGIPFFPSGDALDGFFAFAGSPDWRGQPTVAQAGWTVSVTAGDPIVSVPDAAITPSGTTSDSIGNFIYLYKTDATAANRNLYIGVIVGRPAVGAVEVYPTPQVSWTDSDARVGVSPYASGPLMSRNGLRNLDPNCLPPTEEPATIPISVSAACAHQNRIVCVPQKLQSLNPISAAVSPDPSVTESATIVWSAIAGEPATASSANADGILPLQLAGWPKSQSITLETSGITALVSMDANNLMVLCKDRVLMLSGSLGTVLPNAGVNTSSFNVRTISQEVGCTDVLSVQRTPLGVMFASRDGVYVTDGSRFANTMEEKIQQKWNVYRREQVGEDNRIVGSALLDDTHYVVFTLNGPSFICDLYNDFAWTTFSAGDSYGLPAKFNMWELNIGGAVGSSASDRSKRTIVSSAGSGGSGTNRFATSAIDPISPTWDQVNWSAGNPDYLSWQYDSLTLSGSQFLGVSDDGNLAITYKHEAVAPERGQLYFHTKNIVTNNFSTSGPMIVAGTDLGVEESFAFASESKDRAVLGFSFGGGTSIKVFVVQFDPTTLSYTVEDTRTIAVPILGSYFRVAMTGDGSEYTAVYQSSPGFVTFLNYVRTGTSWSLDSTFTVDVSALPSVWNIALDRKGNGMYFVCCVDSGDEQVYKFFYKTNGVWSEAYSDSRRCGLGTTFAPRIGIGEKPGISYDGEHFVIFQNTEILWPDSYWTAEFRDKTGLLVGEMYISSNYVGQPIPSPFNQYQAGIGSIPDLTILDDFGILPFDLGEYDVADPAFPYTTPVLLHTRTDSGRNAYWRLIPSDKRLSYGYGIRDWTGSREVYAPKVLGDPEVDTTEYHESIVLLDSILITDEVIETSVPSPAPGNTPGVFAQTRDAGSLEPINATVQTRAYTFGYPSTLKAYKTLEFTYQSDPSDTNTFTVDGFYAEGLEPVIDFSGTPIKQVDATPNENTKAARMSLIPRVIDNGVSFGFLTKFANTDYKPSEGKVGRFALYELALNFIALRKGRIKQ